LQRRATERVVPGATGRARRDTDPERPHMLEHAASFNGAEAMTRRGPGPSALGPAGSEPRPQMLARRNTEAQRPSPLDIDNSAYPPTNRGPNSAAPGGQGAGGRNRYQDDMDDVDQYINALSLDTDRNGSPIPTRSNSGSNMRTGMHRNQSHSNGPSPPPSVYDGTSPPNGRSTGPVVAELRRMGSNTRGLTREDSVRSNASGGMYPGSQMNSSPLAYSNSVSSNGTPRSEEGASYLDEPVYAGLRDK
ncbi:hypothetical protein BGZ96_005775, partial [Linnemannia gamsii]